MRNEKASKISSDFQKNIEEVQKKYGDILDVPHPVSETHPPMPAADRAAQFAPFAALTGYKEAIEETERLAEWRMAHEYE